VSSDLDIYRSANVLVKHHGQDAPIKAAMRADAMLDKGDLDGYQPVDVVFPGPSRSGLILLCPA
jgi:23S rRNA A2030 N6-methylase RlmJ